jgi:carboxyl-terminal processing protease
MAVLVDTGTAGPAEIVAAALLDAGRAPLVGEHTFGRAAVQKAVPLADGGLVVTVGRYVSPKGNPIHGKGLEPSVPVQATPEDEPVEGEAARDLILEKALEVLKDEAGKRKAA